MYNSTTIVVQRYIFVPIIIFFIFSTFSLGSVFSQVSVIDEDTFVMDAGLDDIASVLGSSPLARQIVGEENQIQDIAIIDKIQKNSKSIARINLTQPPRDVGTGFLISDSLLMTNNHVFSSPESTKGAIIQFNYQLDVDRMPLPVDTYSVNASVFYTNPDLDYTIVRLNGNPGEIWSFIPISNYSEPSIGNRTTIIHHPMGGYKALTYDDGRIVNIEPTKGLVKYSSDTLKGSSGAPVFNINSDLIALHHFAGDQDMVTGAFLNNEGIMIKKIIEDLKYKLNNDEQGKRVLIELNLH